MDLLFGLRRSSSPPAGQTEAADADAICKGVGRLTTGLVPVRTAKQRSSSPRTVRQIRVRAWDLAATEAVAERTRNGPRPDEIAIGVAAVGVAQARAEEAQAAYQRETALREGITTLALILQTKRDARITAAQLEDARKKLDLLHAGSRAEDIDEANARRDAARATLEEARARLDQCTIRAPAEGTVKVLGTLGQFVSTAVPVTLVEVQSGARS